MSTETTTAEVDEYCTAVRDALADLPTDVRDDLIEDLSDHLLEVSAEGEGTLLERLGEPAAYALDLRAAAGYDAPLNAESASGLQERLLAAARRTVEAGGRADLRLGRLVGYPRLSQLVRALAPGWWVLRGWIVAQLVCAGRHDGWTFIPQVSNSRLFGAVITVALIVASVLLGRSAVRWSAWPRRATYVASAAVAIWGLTVLAPYLTQSNYSFVSAPVDATPYVGANDVYVYDQAGNLVPKARVYDESGNPLNIGSPVCNDGIVSPGVEVNDNSSWTYPLCPNDELPFGSGPGALVPTASTSASASTPTMPPTGPAAATSSAPNKPTAPVSAASSTRP